MDFINHRYQVHLQVTRMHACICTMQHLSGSISHIIFLSITCTDEEYMLANSKDHLNGNNKGIWPSHLVFFSNA